MFRVTISRCCRGRCRTIGNRTVTTGGGNDDNNQDQSEQKLTKADKQSEKSEEEKRRERDVQRKEAAKQKLSELLASLSVKGVPRSEGDGTQGKVVKPVQLSRPRQRYRQHPVADMALRQEFKEAGPEMAAAVRSVSQAVGGGVATQSALLTSLRDMKEKEKSGEPITPGTDTKFMLEGLRVEALRQKPQEDRRRGGLGSLPSGPTEHVRIFDGMPLNIFPTPQFRQDESQEQQQLRQEHVAISFLPTWDALAAKELELLMTRCPANHFQELILWTKQGKIWNFPIDNEFGMEKEAKVGFHEHIFLERHLVPWCPKSGPICHFMELVCVGLSKNPHVPLERKLRHIEWFRDYFTEKEDVLRETGALPADGASLQEEAKAALNK